MSDSANSGRLRPGDLIKQAIGIVMDRFNLDAEQALALLRTMSRNTRTQLCVVAESVINHSVPLEAVRGLEEAEGGRMVRAATVQAGTPRDQR